MKKIFYLLSLIFIIVACSSDDETMGPDTSPNTEPQMVMDTPVNATLRGLVFDENGDPIESAMVILGNQNSITDQFGYFAFPASTVNGSGTLFTVTASGYHKAFQIFNCKEGAELFLSVNMIPKTLSGTISSTSGGLITVNGGASVNLQANSISDANGAPYSGQVDVYAHWLNPIDYQDLSRMPGDLRAVNENNELLQLATYGMMVVELESPTGQPLNLLDGRTAALEFPVPVSLTASAPATIDFWTLNETNGFWEPDGTATFSNNIYRAEVGHFSWFNCDIAFETVNLELCIVEQGSPLGNTVVTLSINSSGRCGFNRSNGNGIVLGVIPANEVLTIGIYDPICDAEMYTQEIGPFTSDAKETIQTNFNANPQIRIVNLNGTFSDCNGVPIVQGFLTSTLGTYHEIINGVINNESFLTCGDQVSFTAFDLVALSSSVTQNYVIDTNPTSINLGDVTICGNALEEFIIAIVDGQTTHTFFDNPRSFFSNANFLEADIDNEGTANISWHPVNTTPANLSDVGIDISVPGHYYFIQSLSVFNVTSFGQNVDEDITGEFEGLFFDEFNGGVSDIPISGTFSIKRDY